MCTLDHSVEMSTQVQTKLGLLEGKQCEDIYGGQYYSFQGIPFAKPPLGALRFKDPLPPEPWEGVRDATKEQEGCYCYDGITKKVVGQEDCLYLNVFTPQLPNNDNPCANPVMVYIHGGGFTSGSATEMQYGPNYLMAHDIVLVTITYRLGALGFLSLYDLSLEVPGNAGLKDQVMALKWVQENIQPFGGNPENVTIFGQSAGGASVHYLLMSPMAKGLFHKAIMQSGSIFNPWAKAKTTGFEFAYYMNISPKNEAEMLKVLQDAPVEDILTAQLSMKDLESTTSLRPFGPIVETSNKNAFMDEDPIDKLIQGNYNTVPIILGYTSRDGLICNFITNIDLNVDNLEKVIPLEMHVDAGSFLATSFVKKIKEFYFPNDAKVEGDSLYQLQTDIMFLRGIHMSTKYHCLTSPDPVYLYRFSMDGVLNFSKDIFKITEVPGACHGDELGYLFTNAAKKDVIKGTQEYQGVLTMARFWTNFAKTGNPNLDTVDCILTVQWKPATKDEMNFIDLDFELKCEVGPEKERMDLWDDIFKMKSSTTKY